VESKDSLQSLAAPVKKEVEPDTKDIKVQGEAENSSSKSDSDSSDRDDDDDDYEDDEFPPVHIKLPLQLDLDDIAGVSASFRVTLSSAGDNSTKKSDPQGRVFANDS